MYFFQETQEKKLCTSYNSAKLPLYCKIFLKEHYGCSIKIFSHSWVETIMALTENMHIICIINISVYLNASLKGVKKGI